MFIHLTAKIHTGLFLETVWPLTALNLEPKFSIPRSMKVDEEVLANGFIGSVISDYFWYVLFCNCVYHKIFSGFITCFPHLALQLNILRSLLTFSRACVFPPFCWNRALSVVWTTPLVATLGMSLTIPLAMVADMVIHGRHFSAIYVLGSVQV